MAHINLISVAEPKDSKGRITRFPFALPIILRGMEKTKHTWDILDTHLHKYSFEDLLKRTETKSMDSKIFGISGWSHNYLQIKHLTKIIRARYSDAIIIVGGIIGGNYNEVLSNTETDIVATGADGEYILPELLDHLDNNEDILNVSGIAFKDHKSQEILQTNYRPTMSDNEFQLVKWPAYKYFEEQIFELVEFLNTFDDVPVKGFPLLTSRGCPYACTYCGHLYGSKFLRQTWDNWFDHVEHLINHYNVPGFYNHDTNMFLKEDEVDEYCKQYAERNHNFEIVIEIRPTFGGYEMYKKLYKHGITVSTFGFESGSEEILKKMKRPMQQMKETKDRLKQCMDSDMRVFGNFVCGTPGESKKTLNETRKFMIQIRKWSIEQKIRLEKKNQMGTSGFGWTIFLPSPPSELYDYAIRDKVIGNEEDYLISLSGKENMKVLKGSKQKIALAQIANHNANMSEFTSKQALENYVRFTLNMAWAQGNFYDFKYFITHVIETGRYFITASFWLIKYYFTLFKDILMKKKGYTYNPTVSGHYLQKKEKVITKRGITKETGVESIDRLFEKQTKKSADVTL